MRFESVSAAKQQTNHEHCRPFIVQETKCTYEIPLERQAQRRERRKKIHIVNEYSIFNACTRVRTQLKSSQIAQIFRLSKQLIHKKSEINGTTTRMLGKL